MGNQGGAAYRVADSKRELAKIDKEGLRVFGRKRSELPSKLVARYARKLKDLI